MVALLWSSSHPSERSKRRKTEEVREILTTSELAYAAQMSIRSSGQLDAAEVVKNATLTSPTRALKYRKALETKPEVTLSADAALSYLVDCKLSKSDYQALRSLSVGQHCRMVPPYSKVAEARKLLSTPYSYYYYRKQSRSAVTGFTGPYSSAYYITST